MNARVKHDECHPAAEGRGGVAPGEPDRGRMGRGAGHAEAARHAAHHPDRVAALDWSKLSSELDNQGSALIERLLEPEECRSLAAIYPQDSRFRSRVVM